MLFTLNTIKCFFAKKCFYLESFSLIEKNNLNIFSYYRIVMNYLISYYNEERLYSVINGHLKFLYRSDMDNVEFINGNIADLRSDNIIVLNKVY